MSSRILLPLLLGLGLHATAAAQGDPPVPGRTAQRVAAAGDSTHSYALYLPSSWSAERHWPVLLLLDPGGRALLPLERFRPAAERYGWVLLSSYDVRNGGGPVMAANDRAVDALLADAQRRYGADLRRLYLGGHSGMARYAWSVAVNLDGHVAGLFSAGAGFPQAAPVWLAVLREAHPFPWFGTAGSTDFNLEELETVDSLLDASAFPHRLRVFAGEHAWPPAEVAEEAVAWFELHAVQAGTRQADAGWTDSLHRAARSRASALAARGELAAAEREWRAVVADYASTPGTAEDAAALAALRHHPGLRRDQARQTQRRARVQAQRERVDAVFEELRRAPDGVLRAGTLSALRIPALQAEAADSAGDPARSRAATRMLTTLLVAATDQGGEHLRARRYAAAASAFAIALQLRPGNGPVCRARAGALARSGQTAAAMQALRCALDARALTAAQAREDTLLAPLRDEAAFEEMVGHAP